jgi:hypothetical protein
MVQIISFDEALKRTGVKSRTLLLGNGFSIRHFNYKNLLDRSGLPANDSIRALFAALDVVDFEIVMRALEEAALVERAYKREEQAKIFLNDATRLRASFIHAIRNTHPPHRENILDVIPSCIQFLKQFQAIFTLNYDLLLYWVMLDDTASFHDGFGLGRDWGGGFRGPFKPEARCNVYNLHGGLHLFRTADGEVEKKLMGASGVVDAIADTITREKRLPLYIAEGTSSAKLNRINSTAYLRHCYQTLSDSKGYFFIFGHSAARNDEHAYRALFGAGIDHLYFCVHTPTAKVNELDAELARYKRLFESKVNYTFVDSASAHVWDRSIPKSSTKTAARD